MWEEFYKKKTWRRMTIQYINKELGIGLEILYLINTNKFQVGTFSTKGGPRRFPILDHNKYVGEDIIYTNEHFKLREFNTEEEAMRYTKGLMGDEGRLKEEMALQEIRGNY
ncbi:MAG: hypothetical protein AMQ74_01858 [Candidatus Methanofastidiosum methylothiophilum]|uniref:Uncharacterized protein n=1 Tax=Candidatus Methanofastidiosum methylothiophilum TaxID=1705564 RepID=A0A150IMJ2_9EURY|nr:MAG: hypothetical protein AMQ74_01858 [Candidatus Methanofastidiosum methylthiophilus]